MARKASPPALDSDFREEPGAIVVDDEEGDFRGTVRISLAVVTEMVELTVQDIDGVAGVKGKRRIAGIFPHATSNDGDQSVPVKEREHSGIKVRVQGNQLDAEVTVLVASNVNIPELGRTIQAKIGTAAERTLGMTAGEINVHVAGIQTTEMAH